MPYDIQFAEVVAEHLTFLSAGEQSRVFAAIEEQLLHEPLKETRNRKPLRPNPLAPWELRVGNLRVFYDVVSDPPEVNIVAIGKKQGSILRIAGQEFKL